jgi:hypothetical protein
MFSTGKISELFHSLTELGKIYHPQSGAYEEVGQYQFAKYLHRWAVNSIERL